MVMWRFTERTLRHSERIEFAVSIRVDRVGWVQGRLDDGGACQTDSTVSVSWKDNFVLDQAVFRERKVEEIRVYAYYSGVKL